MYDVSMIFEQHEGVKKMRVTKAQAQANREHIVETASVLFRERGFDGVGVADLMAAAGFTHGGFYKHFGSKADLMAEAAASSLAQSLTDNAGIDVADFVDLYVSRDHRDGRGGGCTMAALCGDAARQSPELKATFANGIEKHAGRARKPVRGRARRAAGSDQGKKMLDMLAHAVGAIMLSRACPDDSALADEILEVCRARIIAALPPSPAKQP
nr:TetR family transcriptional regulator [Pseudomonas brassicacearum subsp. brassicacearum]